MLLQQGEITMSTILLAILPLLKKFWLPILITVVMSSLLIHTYYKGVHSCEDRINRVIIEEQTKSQQEIEKVLRKGSDVRKRIGNNPSDKAISCILSSNPMKVTCNDK